MKLQFAVQYQLGYLTFQTSFFRRYSTTEMSDPDTRKQLLSAISRSNYEEVQNLINGDTDFASADTEWPRLFSRCTDISIANLLIENGARLEAKDKRGKTALIRCWRPAVAKFLVEFGADVNARCSSGHTVLSSNAFWKDWNFVSFFINQGATAWSSHGNKAFIKIIKSFIKTSCKSEYSVCDAAIDIL